MPDSPFNPLGGISAFGQVPSTSSAPAPVQAAAPVSRAGGKKPRILLADSEHAFREDTKKLLEGNGYEVETVDNGRDLVAKVKASNPDIAVVDQHLLGLSGMDVARALRRNPIYCSLPLIMMTRSSNRMDKIESLKIDVDDFIPKVGALDELLARLGMILRRNKSILDSNALTHLPGNRTIDERITERIQLNQPLAVMYFDLNNFKAYNDCYGFEAGDVVIHSSAKLLAEFVEMPGGERDFLGHIGGDDFIYVTTPDRAEMLAPQMCERYEAMTPSFYNETDRARGYIDSVDRQGNPRKFGLVGVAIGIVHNRLRKIESFGQVAQIGAELKHVAKEMGERSHWFMDRRGPDDKGQENRSPAVPTLPTLPPKP
jgi:diguanylate cyclase (GGDEF)-like protein